MLRAFSLVELSIVLVILGLLTGGILAGQSLIRAAELRAVVTEYQRYIAATNAFRDKYFAIPGDFLNATSFWGAAGSPAAGVCQAATHTGTATCNGDGDGVLKFNALLVQEGTHYWQHLANAGLIEGSYNGAMVATPGVSAPASKLAPNYFYATYGGYNAGSATTFSGDFGKNMYYYWNNSYGASTAGSAPFKPEEAWNIDTKLDDGKPGSGTIYAAKGDNSNTFCTSADNVAPPGDANATYALNKTGKDCVLQFLRAF